MTIASNALLLFLVTILVPELHGHQCGHQITNYAKCMTTNLAHKFHFLESELQLAKQQKINNCFTSVAKCPSPQFHNANVEYFVPDAKWQKRFHDLFSFLENIDPRVNRCMARKLVKVTIKWMEECVRKKGVSDFRLPEIDTRVNMNMEHLKQVVLNRMMIRFALRQCMMIHEHVNASEFRSCLHAAKFYNFDNETCTVRRDCTQQNVKDDVCLKRLEDVLQASCSCLEETINKTTSRNSFSLLSSGLNEPEIEETFRQCHTKLGIEFPQDKLNTFKEVIKTTVADIILQKQVPDIIKTAIRFFFGCFKRPRSRVDYHYLFEMFQVKQLKNTVQEG